MGLFYMKKMVKNKQNNNNKTCLNKRTNKAEKEQRFQTQNQGSLD